jgi:hypothetical protein
VTASFARPGSGSSANSKWRLPKAKGVFKSLV